MNAVLVLLVIFAMQVVVALVLWWLLDGGPR